MPARGRVASHPSKISAVSGLTDLIKAIEEYVAPQDGIDHFSRAADIYVAVAMAFQQAGLAQFKDFSPVGLSLFSD